MTRQIALGMLAQGNTGAELLQILELIQEGLWLTLRAVHSALFEYSIDLFVRQQQSSLLWGPVIKKHRDPNLQRWQFDFDITLRKKIPRIKNDPQRFSKRGLQKVAYIIRRWVSESVKKFSVKKWFHNGKTISYLRRNAMYICKHQWRRIQDYLEYSEGYCWINANELYWIWLILWGSNIQ